MTGYAWIIVIMFLCIQKGRTALYWAASADVKIVQMLIDYGAAVDLGRDKVVTVMPMCEWRRWYGFITRYYTITIYE